MTLSTLFGRSVRGLAVGTAILAAVGLSTASRPAYAIDPGAAAGIGLGSLAVGTMLGAAANPYYSPYYSYGYYYPPAPAYYPTVPYYPPRSCWDPYYRRYYAC